MRLPAAAAEALEGTLQPSAVGPWVHGADADCSVSCHVSIFKAGKVFQFLLIYFMGVFLAVARLQKQVSMHHHLLYMQYAHAVVIKEHYHLFSASFLPKGISICWLEESGIKLPTLWLVNKPICLFPYDLFQQKPLDFWLAADPIYLLSRNHLPALRAVWSCRGQSEWCKWSWKEILYLLWL